MADQEYTYGLDVNMNGKHVILCELAIDLHKGEAVCGGKQQNKQAIHMRGVNIQCNRYWPNEKQVTITHPGVQTRVRRSIPFQSHFSYSGNRLLFVVASRKVRHSHKHSLETHMPIVRSTEKAHDEENRQWTYLRHVSPIPVLEYTSFGDFLRAPVQIPICKRHGCATR